MFYYIIIIITGFAVLNRYDLLRSSGIVFRAEARYGRAMRGQTDATKPPLDRPSRECLPVNLMDYLFSKLFPPFSQYGRISQLVLVHNMRNLLRNNELCMHSIQFALTGTQVRLQRVKPPIEQCNKIGQEVWQTEFNIERSNRQRCSMLDTFMSLTTGPCKFGLDAILETQCFFVRRLTHQKQPRSFTESYAEYYKGSAIKSRKDA